MQNFMLKNLNLLFVTICILNLQVSAITKDPVIPVSVLPPSFNNAATSILNPGSVDGLSQCAFNCFVKSILTDSSGGLVGTLTGIWENANATSGTNNFDKSANNTAQLILVTLCKSTAFAPSLTSCCKFHKIDG
jgi:hypothetical protein